MDFLRTVTYAFLGDGDIQEHPKEILGSRHEDICSRLSAAFFRLRLDQFFAGSCTFS